MIGKSRRSVVLLVALLAVLFPAATSFAQKTCIATGDTNCNGLISTADMVIFANFFRYRGISLACPYEVDINGDCVVDIHDLEYFAQHCWGCMDCPPCPKPPTCCNPVVRACCLGDPNQSWSGPTISDVSTMVTAKFVTGNCDAICIPGADINRSGGDNPTCADITISDISMLVNCLFVIGDPGPCIEPTCAWPFSSSPAELQAKLGLE